MSRYDDRIKCFKCHKYIYPVSLTNTDSKTWCGCDKVGVPDGWSGNKYVQPKRKWK